MKIYEIMIGDNEPLYAKSKKHIKELMIEWELKETDIDYITEKEFEYNLDSICNLCDRVHR
jgi:hypothetical protein